jgi:RNA polymerase sigma-70 factor (ECF subfamily)
VKSRAINILKKGNRIHDKPIEEWEDELEFESADTPVDEQVIDQIGYDRLVALISRLCESQRNIFEMRYVQFFTNDEIAEELGVDAKTVENRLYKAKLKLRKLLESEEARTND